MSEGFLSRWSRRKREPPTDETAPSSAPSGAPEAAEAEATAGGRAAEAEITPEELALLPSLDDLTAETDIAAFLRRGVPRALRDAALRRAWALDPKIRDFVCEAREYAYDWNVPGGVPGSGDLLPTDDVPGMIRQIFGEAPSEAIAGEPSPSASGLPPAAETGLRDASWGREAGPPDAASEASPALEVEEGALPQDGSESAVGRLLEPAQLPTDDATRPRDDLAGARSPEALNAVPLRRHGRAAPI
jgi:Protein of unknown function (DUF3306)